MSVSIRRQGWPKITIWLLLATFGLLWLSALLLFPFGELITHYFRNGADSLPVSTTVNSMITPLAVSAAYAFIAAGLSILLALPIAIVIAGSSSYKSSLIASAFLAPLFVNLLLRIYAVRYLVLDGGYIASLYKLLSDGPILGTQVLLILGLVYLYLPFAVIPMTISLMSIDVPAIEAGVAVGLRGLPLTLAVARVQLFRGIFISWILTFVPAFGDYLAPAVLGGDKTRMVANYLYDQAILADKASVAAVGVVILWTSTFIAMYGARLLDRKSPGKNRRMNFTSSITPIISKITGYLRLNKNLIFRKQPSRQKRMDWAFPWNTADVYSNPLSRCLPVNPALVFSIVIIIIAWLPVVYAVLISFSRGSQAALPRGVSFLPIERAFNDSTITWSLLRSFEVAAFATILSVLFGGVVSIAANIHGRRLLKALTYVFLFPLVTPDVMIGLSLGHFAKEINLQLTWPWIAVAHSIFGSSLVFYVVSAAYDRKARDIIDAAAVLGVIRVRYIVPLIYNLMKRAVIAGALVAFVVSLDDFAVTYFLTRAGEATFPVTIYNRLSKGLQPQYFAAALLLAVVNMSLVAFIIYKFGLNAFGIKEKTDEAV
jgi:ABC-type spermidine/putrescine transport system permease subunit II